MRLLNYCNMGFKNNTHHNNDNGDCYNNGNDSSLSIVYNESERRESEVVDKNGGSARAKSQELYVNISECVNVSGLSLSIVDNESKISESVVVDENAGSACVESQKLYGNIRERLNVSGLSIEKRLQYYRDSLMSCKSSL